MENKYTGVKHDRRYTGEHVEVTYNRKRCIHARECVKNLPAVFDTNRRPWILPEAGETEAIARVIELCPSGALHYFPKDGSPGEAIPGTNVVTLMENSYLQIRGLLRIAGSNVDIQTETRAALCRCGASNNKPFCDNSHREIKFRTPLAPLAPEDEGTETATGGELLITLTTNGPIELTGNFEIRTENGALVFRGSKEWLCRCGSSQNKPFCDNSHRRIGFIAP